MNTSIEVNDKCDAGGGSSTSSGGNNSSSSSSGGGGGDDDNDDADDADGRFHTDTRRAIDLVPTANNTIVPP